VVAVLLIADAVVDVLLAYALVYIDPAAAWMVLSLSLLGTWLFALRQVLIALFILRAANWPRLLFCGFTIFSLVYAALDHRWVPLIEMYPWFAFRRGISLGIQIVSVFVLLAPSTSAWIRSNRASEGGKGVLSNEIAAMPSGQPRPHLVLWPALFLGCLFVWNAFIYAQAIAGMIDVTAWPYNEPKDAPYLWLEFVQYLVLIAFSIALYCMKRIASWLLVLAATIEVLAIAVAIKNDPPVFAIIYGVTIVSSLLGFGVGLIYVRYLRLRGVLT
jgi:hypothetical protein